MISSSDLAPIMSEDASVITVSRQLPEHLEFGPLCALPFCIERVLNESNSTRSLLELVSPGELRDFLEEDINALLSAFRQVVPGRSARATLEVVTTDSCRKFHQDNVGLRMLCTYAGPGTLWIPQARLNAPLHHFRHIGDIPRFNEALAPEGSIEQATTGDVVLLKGKRWASQRAAVHRAPPIQRDGLRRLLFKIDVDGPFSDAKESRTCANG